MRLPGDRGPVRKGSAAEHDRALVLVPVKAFHHAKQRLAGALSPEQRAHLARSMAEKVLAAAAPLRVAVVCDDPDVATWARTHGAAVIWTPGLGLNGALEAAVEQAAEGGAPRVIIAHSDMPFARDLARFAVGSPDTVTLVPDRRLDGTNVLAMDPTRAIPLGYGAGSFRRHRDRASEAGLEVEVVTDDLLAWDVDGPLDLSPPLTLGVVEVL